MPEGAGGTEPRTWTIYVCPECGTIAPPFMARDGGYECCSGHDPIACEYVRVVEQQPPTEEPSERVSYDTPERTSSRGPIQAVPGPPEPTQGNEWDPATVDAVVEALPEFVSITNAQLARLRERFKGAARDTGGRDDG